MLSTRRASEQSTRPTRARSRDAKLTTERKLLNAGCALVGGMDEVGRGAWAGPLMVGVVVVAAPLTRPPAGTKDSKLLSRARREALVELLKDWCHASAIGEASPTEVDALGLTAASRLAARRALDALPSYPNVLLLDGSHDYVTDPDLDGARDGSLEVRTIVSGDRLCATVAAASVLAKVARDRLMREYAIRHPAYGFDRHVGYCTSDHVAAVTAHGLCDLHRRTWTLAVPSGFGPKDADDVGRPLVAGTQ